MSGRPAEAESVLQVDDVIAGYEDLTILHGVTITVGPGELVVVIGPNGAGKSTLLKAIVGLLPCASGTVQLGTEVGSRIDVTRLTPSKRTRLGLGFLPQLDNVFPNMTVIENLKVGAYLRRREMDRALEEAFEEFPLLHERRRQRAGTLSGGQRKMLALARALLSKPRLLLLDEPSAALSPVAMEEVMTKLLELRARGLPLLVVEQNARRALRECDYAYVLDMGRNRFEGHGDELLRDDRVVQLYLGGQPSGRPDHGSKASRIAEGL